MAALPEAYSGKKGRRWHGAQRLVLHARQVLQECRFDVRVIVCECGTVVTVVADRYNWYFRCHVGPLDNLFIK